MLLLVACVGIVGMFAVGGGAAPHPPRVMAVVPSATGPRLKPLDARTLAPLRGGWSRPVTKDVAAVLSPSGSRVAVVGKRDTVLVLDTATGRIIRKYGGETAYDLYWLGGDGTVGSRPELLVAVDEGCSSGRCGAEYSIVGDGFSIGVEGWPETEAALYGGLAYAFDPNYLGLLGSNGIPFSDGWELSKMPPTAPFRIAADVAHDRLFVISSAGLVAEIDHIPYDLSQRPRIRYHRVELNGHPFEAAWAGAGKIALWGQDGLGTIDVRTWKTHAIARGVTGAVATPHGVAAWTEDPADGVTIYRPDGRKRLHVLHGKRVHAVHTVGHFLYVDAEARYSVDLITGKVLGPLGRGARIMVPDLVPIS
jgi:hypothetical protein